MYTDFIRLFLAYRHSFVCLNCDYTVFSSGRFSVLFASYLFQIYMHNHMLHIYFQIFILNDTIPSLSFRNFLENQLDVFPIFPFHYHSALLFGRLACVIPFIHSFIHSSVSPLFLTLSHSLYLLSLNGARKNHSFCDKNNQQTFTLNARQVRREK